MIGMAYFAVVTGGSEKQPEALTDHLGLCSAASPWAEEGDRGELDISFSDCGAVQGPISHLIYG